MSLDAQLRILIAKWRADLRVTSAGAADRESRVVGAAIEDCADALEEIVNSVLIDQVIRPSNVQCMLLSGLGHGKVLMVDEGLRSIRWSEPGKRSAQQRYIMENYVHDQKTYRIATHNATPGHFEQLPSMIRDTGLLAIDL